MLNVLGLVSCKGLDANFDSILPSTISLIVTGIKIAVPIILIIMGMLDLAKAVMANEEKEIKGATSKFIKRIIAAAVIFFVVAIVQLVFGVLDSNAKDESSQKSCISCFINNNCSAPIQ